MDAVSVDVECEFDGVGEPASTIRYRVSVESPEPEDRITELLRHTDTVAEIQNSLRSPVAVELAEVTVRPGTSAA